MKKLLFALLFTGCQTIDWDKVGQTGTHVTQRVAQIALYSVLQSALNQQDVEHRKDFLDGAADGIRQNLLTISSAEDVKKIVDIWTPEERSWKKLSVGVANTFERYQDAAPEKKEQVLEGIAKGLQVAAQ